MCGRYYVDDETAKEIEKMVRLADEKRKNLSRKDIHPTELAPVLYGQNRIVSWENMRWGFPGFEKKQVIFNARSESVLEKNTFRESTLHRRIVVPAAGFYEWNRQKEKNLFYRKNHPVLFMAGIYKRYQDEDRFVILTTEANASMSPVHDRMPLLLQEDDILPWMFDDSEVQKLLAKQPELLERRTEYEQLSLF